MTSRFGVLLLTLLALLTACPDTRVAVNFDTDPQILRGSWNFVLKDPSTNAVIGTQAVVFTPTLLSDNTYSVAATVTLNGESYALAGTVLGVNTKFVRPQTTLLPPAWFTLTGQTGAKRYFASLGVPSQSQGSWTYSGRLNAERMDASTEPENYILEITRN
jgi:hypothetical protein